MPSPAQEQTKRAHETQLVLKLLAGQYVEPNGECEVAKLEGIIGDELVVRIKWKDSAIDLEKEKI